MSRRNILADIEQQRGILRAAKSDLDRPEKILAEIESLDERIEKLQHLRELARHRYDNRQQRYDDCVAELHRLKAELPEAVQNLEHSNMDSHTKAVVKNAVTLQKLMEQMKALED